MTGATAQRSTSETITTTNVRGVEMSLVTSNRALSLCARMNYETEVLDFIDALSPHTVFYDLGACEGRFSIYAALKGLEVYAFEPEEKNFKVFQENIALNQKNIKGRIFPSQVALGESNHQSTLKIAQDWAGGHQKVVSSAPSRTDLDFDFKLTQTIDVVSLDELIVRKSHPVPQALKVDIDGSEIPFLKGAKKTLTQSTLKKILFELSDEDPGTKLIENDLLELGFTLVQKFQIPDVPYLFNVLFEREPS
jgi:FkbM family methyltransferase